MTDPIKPKSLRPHKTAQTIIYYQGTERTLREWCQLLVLSYSVVRMRFNRGETDLKKLFAPTPVPKTGLVPKNPRANRLKQITYPAMFYILPPEIQKVIRDECDMEPKKVEAYLVNAIVTHTRQATPTGLIEAVKQRMHPDDPIHQKAPDDRRTTIPNPTPVIDLELEDLLDSLPPVAPYNP